MNRRSRAQGASSEVEARGTETSKHFGGPLIDISYDQGKSIIGWMSARWGHRSGNARRQPLVADKVPNQAILWAPIVNILLG